MRTTPFSLAVLVAALLARPATACCQLGGTACGDPFAVDCNNGVVCFPPYRSCPSCTCVTTAAGKTCLTTTSVPGTVTTLVLARSTTPGDLDVSWSPSCNPAIGSYTVHEGAIGSWYSHEARACTSGGVLAATVTPFGGSRYYLVAPVSGTFTGSLGVASVGAERPDGAPTCTDDRALAPCP